MKSFLPRQPSHAKNIRPHRNDSRAACLIGINRIKDDSFIFYDTFKKPGRMLRLKYAALRKRINKAADQTPYFRLRMNVRVRPLRDDYRDFRPRHRQQNRAIGFRLKADHTIRLNPFKRSPQQFDTIDIRA